MRECPQARGEKRSEPAVRITALSSEIQPIQSLAESPNILPTLLEKFTITPMREKGTIGLRLVLSYYNNCSTRINRW